jgi:hypothetical protein
MLHLLNWPHVELRLIMVVRYKFPDGFEVHRPPYTAAEKHEMMRRIGNGPRIMTTGPFGLNSRQKNDASIKTQQKISPVRG